MKQIRVSSGSVSMIAELNESPTAEAIWQALPIVGTANTWGDEIYFDIPVSREEEQDSRTEVEVGELGYWPAGTAFCIFFGRTPASRGSQPRAASPVNIVGRLLGDATEFCKVEGGAMVRLEQASE